MFVNKLFAFPFNSLHSCNPLFTLQNLLKAIHIPLFITFVFSLFIRVYIYNINTSYIHLKVSQACDSVKISEILKRIAKNLPSSRLLALSLIFNLFVFVCYLEITFTWKVHSALKVCEKNKEIQKIRVSTKEIASNNQMALDYKLLMTIKIVFLW